MYFTILPDSKKPGFDEKAHFAKFGKNNIIFNAITTRSECERHVGCLSIKTVARGEEWYGIEGQNIAVRPGQFLILNDDQPYSSRVDSVLGAHIVSVFFKKEFASTVYRQALLAIGKSLEGDIGGIEPPEFLQTLYEMKRPMYQDLKALLFDLEEGGYEPNRIEEHLVFLLHGLVQAHRGEVLHSGNVMALKASTRKEVYKRLCAAKDLMHSSFMEKLDLSLIGNVACLSTPQLVRQYKAVFGLTPYQYLAKLRLAHAAQLIKQTPTPISEITWACGFEDNSAFCRAFKKAYSLTPEQFRKGRL